MISSLTGSLAEVEGSRVTLDVQGVGYEIYCTTAALLELSKNPNNIRILVHTEVKEDSLRLFGFADRLEREVFRLLISITGIGAKTSVEILSATEAKALLRTIASGGAPELQKIKGIGKKTAERIIVELRDKVSAHIQEIGQDSASVSFGKERIVLQNSFNVTPEEKARDEANQALCALGFRKEDADKALAAIPGDFKGRGDAASLVKAALQYI